VCRLLCVSAALALVVYFSAPAAATPVKLKDLKLQVQEFEKHAQWGKACSVYAKILELQSSSPDARERYFFCLRRYLQECRHSDPSYLKEVLTLEVPQAKRLYEFILTYLAEHSLESDRVTPKALFHKGLEELDAALASPVFLAVHIEKTHKDKVTAFRKSLHDHWKKKAVTSIPQAVSLVHAVATEARQKLNLKMVASIMEFTCGSCYAVDDYTMYLTPTELRGLCNTLKGEAVGVGLKLGLKGDKMVITDVAPDSPAKDLKIPLARFDQVLSIDGKSTAKMPPEVAADLLYGETGTEVELEIYSPAHGTRVVSLQRRSVFVPSVRYEYMSGQVGYLSITNFQASTVQELDAALSSLSKMEIKALVLDLRGNSGGIFGVAVDVARRFLNNGVIVSTQTYDKQTTTYHAQNAAATTVPLVVLIDGKTASAAEILAGALKENRRARLVGLPTFGKGCIQEVYSLSPGGGMVFPGGLRVTVARFLSPDGHPYTGKGILPHITVDGDPMGKADLQLQEAFAEAERLIEELNKPEMKM